MTKMTLKQCMLPLLTLLLLMLVVDITTITADADAAAALGFVPYFPAVSLG